MRKILVTLAVLTVPMSALTLGIAGGTAGAVGKLVCTTITGNASSTLVVSGCTGGDTGGSSEPVTATALATGGTVDWVSGSSTTIAAPTLTSISAKKCPGYVKDGASNPAAESFTASVTADHGDGVLLPSTATGEVCISSSGAITALKSFTTTWTSSDVVCTSIAGNASSTVTVSGCTGGHTGGGSEPLEATTLATGGTIDWLSGGSVTIGAPTLTATSAKQCPGYVKNGASNPAAEKFTAAITSDTGDGLKLPGEASGAVCIASSGAITALKSLAAK
jgi:hypothetical protein